MKKRHPLGDTIRLGGLVGFTDKLLVDIHSPGAQFWIYLRRGDGDKPVSRTEIHQHIIITDAGKFQHAGYTLDGTSLEKGKALLCLRYSHREQRQAKQKRRK